MTVLNPSEFRYGAISSLGLIIFTTLLKWTGVGSTRYKPTKPDTTNASKFNSTSQLDFVFNPGDFSSINNSQLLEVLELIVLPLQIFVDLLLTWGSVWDSLGFISIFIIAPMTVMLIIIAGVVITLWEAIYPG